MKFKFQVLLFLMHMGSVSLIGQSQLQNITPRANNDPSDTYKIEFIRDRLKLEKSLLDSISKKDYLSKELVHELFLTTRDTVKNEGIKHNLNLFLMNSPAREKIKEMLIYFMQLERDYPNQPMSKFNPFTKEQQKEWDENGGPNLTTYTELKEFYILLNAPMVLEMNGEKVKSKEEKLKDDLINILEKKEEKLELQKLDNPFESLEFRDFKEYYMSYLEYGTKEQRNFEFDYSEKKISREEYIEKRTLFKKTLPAMLDMLKYKGKIFIEAYPEVLKVYGLDRILEEIEK